MVHFPLPCLIARGWVDQTCGWSRNMETFADHRHDRNITYIWSGSIMFNWYVKIDENRWRVSNGWAFSIIFQGWRNATPKRLRWWNAEPLDPREMKLSWLAPSRDCIIRLASICGFVKTWSIYTHTHIYIYIHIHILYIYIYMYSLFHEDVTFQ